MMILMMLMLVKRSTPEEGNVKAMAVVVVAWMHMDLVHTVRLQRFPL